MLGILLKWKTGHRCYKYTSFIFIHELPIPQRRVAVPRRGRAWRKGLGLLGGGSCSDKMKSLQEEKSCWLKAFVQVSLQDLSGRGCPGCAKQLDLDDTPKWSQAVCISLCILFNFSLSLVSYLYCHKLNQKVKRRTKQNKQARKLILLLIEWVVFDLNLEPH